MSGFLTASGGGWLQVKRASRVLLQESVAMRECHQVIVDTACKCEGMGSGAGNGSIHP